MQKYFKLALKCPVCGKSLMDETKKIHEQDSIKLQIDNGKEKGNLWLCSYYGCFDHNSDIKLEVKEVVKMYCPHCKEQLPVEDQCDKCGAPLVRMNLIVGGHVSICSRKGCDNHFVVFKDLNDALSLFDKEFKYLGNS